MAAKSKTAPVLSQGAPWRSLERVCTERLPKLEPGVHGGGVGVHTPAEEDFTICFDFLLVRSPAGWTLVPTARTTLYPSVVRPHRQEAAFLPLYPTKLTVKVESQVRDECCAQQPCTKKAEAGGL